MLACTTTFGRLVGLRARCGVFICSCPAAPWRSSSPPRRAGARGRGGDRRHQGDPDRRVDRQGRRAASRRRAVACAPRCRPTARAASSRPATPSPSSTSTRGRSSGRSSWREPAPRWPSPRTARSPVRRPPWGDSGHRRRVAAGGPRIALGKNKPSDSPSLPTAPARQRSSTASGSRAST